MREECPNGTVHAECECECVIVCVRRRCGRGPVSAPEEPSPEGDTAGILPRASARGVGKKKIRKRKTTSGAREVTTNLEQAEFPLGGGFIESCA